MRSAPTPGPDDNALRNRTQAFGEAVTVPAYLIVHPREQRREDVHIEGADVTLTVTDGWAIFTDHAGICLAIPAGLGAQVQRVDEPQDTSQEPAPPKE